jgi:hypothetical protein
MRATWLSSLNLRWADVAALLQKAHPPHQLRPVVLHVADLGPDFPCIDRAGIGLYKRRRLVGRAAPRHLTVSHQAVALGGSSGGVTSAMLRWQRRAQLHAPG